MTIEEMATAIAESTWEELHQHAKTIYHGKNDFMETYKLAFIHGYNYGRCDEREEHVDRVEL